MTPPLLHKGDRVAIVATARKVSPAEMEPAIGLLNHWGLDVQVDDSLFAAENQFAGSDTHRADCLQKAIDDPRIRAIFCARGGYGTVRMVDRVDFSPLLRNPKWIVGYSDVTVLHSHLHNVLNIETLHAIMPINIPAQSWEKNLPAIESLRQLLFEGSASCSFPSHPLSRAGEAEGVVVGGNLSILYSLMGSASDISTDGKILFIEDLDEYLYHIDRMMWCLRRAGKLNNLKALIVGAMSDMHDNATAFGKSAEEIVREAVEDFDYPVCFNAPFGHIGTENRALPLGRNVKISVGKESKIMI